MVAQRQDREVLPARLDGCPASRRTATAVATRTPGRRLRRARDPPRMRTPRETTRHQPADMTLGGHAGPPRSPPRTTALISQKRNSSMARTNTTHLCNIRKGSDPQVKHSGGGMQQPSTRQRGDHDV